MEKAIFIRANYDEYPLRYLYDERGEEKIITWKCRLNNEDYIKIGTTVLIYYRNLPDGINRVLLKAKIRATNVNYNDLAEGLKTESEKELATNKTFIRAIQIESIRGIFPEDPLKFSRKELIEKYSIDPELNQSTAYYLREEHQKLISDISEYSGRELNWIRKRVIENCIFDGEIKLDLELKHTTFRSKYGIPYYERHHFIPDSTKLKDEDQKNVIDHEDNYVNLCVSCHKRIHEGNSTDIKKMLYAIYHHRKEFYDQALEKYVEKGRSTIDFVCEKYREIDHWNR